jgi:BirA family biotin operon repressor/biotin-[acetyl-CoA-carboxylase] ligase
MTSERGWESECHLPLDARLLSSGSPWKVPVQVLQETTSSNDEVLRMGENGCPSGTLLFAERQTAGRGQFHRPWSSAPGLGLWFSLLLRLPINDATIPSLSVFAAVALMETLSELKIRNAAIKAPNDILIAGKKVAGILVETRTGKDPFAVVGIGVNVNQRRDDFPEELQDRAASLAMFAGVLFDRNAVASELISQLGKAERLMRESPEKLLSSWTMNLQEIPKSE